MDRSATGNVVIKNSERSLVSPRSAMTDIGGDAVNVKVPISALPPLNGASFRNFAICPLAGMIVDPWPKSAPVVSVK